MNTLITNNMNKAMRDLLKAKELVKTPDGLAFSIAPYEPGCNRHSLHTIQQLVSDGLVTPVDFVPSGLGFKVFTKIIVKD